MIPCGKFSGVEVKFSTPRMPALMIGSTRFGATFVGEETMTIEMSLSSTTSSKESIW